MTSDELKFILAQASGNAVNEADINDDTDIIDNLGFDSIMYLKALLAIEEKSGVELDDEDIDDISVFSSLLAKINK